MTSLIELIVAMETADGAFLTHVVGKPTTIGLIFI